MTSRTRRVASLAVITLLLMTSVVGPAAASTSPAASGSTSGAAMFTAPTTICTNSIESALTSLIIGSGSCGVPTSSTSSVQNVVNTSNNITQLNIYDAALSQKASAKNFNTVSENYINDSQNVAWSNAEMAIANAYANNSSESVAASKAKKAIANYYARMQYNQLKSWNTTASADLSLNRRANSSGWNSLIYEKTTGTTNYPSIYRKTGLQTLTNGSNVHSVVIGFGTSAVSYQLNITTPYSAGIQVASTSGGSSETIFDAAAYSARWSRIQSINSRLRGEAGNYTQHVYNALQAGAITPSQITSRDTKMFQMAAGSGANNSSMYRSLALYASMGLSTPNVTSTGTMTVHYNGTDYTGLLLASQAPGGKWQVNTTYTTTPGTPVNATNISGQTLIATTRGQTVNVHGAFTLSRITNNNGQNVTNVTAKRRSYQTTNVSALEVKLNRTDALVNQLQNRLNAAGGGASSGGSGGGGGSSVLVIGGLGVAAILVVMVIQKSS